MLYVRLFRNSTPSEIENQREEKFQIDLMVRILFSRSKVIFLIFYSIYAFFFNFWLQAPPPLRSSPERDGDSDFVAVDLRTVIFFFILSLSSS